MKYQAREYHKASVSVTLRYTTENVRAETCVYFALHLTCRQTDVIAIAFLFYDKASVPDGLFDDFLAIPSTQKDVSTRSYLDLVTSNGYFKPTSGSTDRLVPDPVSKSNDKSKLT
jgi:hypothetical protein